MVALSPYIPHGAADALMYDARGAASEVVVSGPAGTGKTLACLWKCAILADQYPGARILIIRKTRRSMTESVLVTFERHVFPANHPEVLRQQRAFRTSYKFPNDSEIIVGGLDNVDRIMSTEFDLIYVAEATECTENEWETLTTRLRHTAIPNKQIIGDCNPGGPSHWLKVRCDNGHCVMLESRHEDNPLLWVDDAWTVDGVAYIAKLDALTGVRKERLRYGRWIAAEGVIFPEWDARVHLVDRFDIPRDWRRIRSIDFGHSHPFVCGWFAIDPDGRMFLYRYIYMTRRLVADHAATINEATGDERIEVTVSDHDAEDRATLHAAGVYTVPAIKTVKPGLDAVSRRLRDERLFIMRDGLIEADQELIDAKQPWQVEQEFDLYTWPRHGTMAFGRDLPMKEYDHGMDMIRYAAMYVDGRPGRPVPYERIERRMTGRRAALRAV